MTSKALYAPYKAVGLVTDGLPIHINRLGEENFIYASIGKSFQVFKFDHLSVCLASKPLPGEITAMISIGHETIVASGKTLYVYNRISIVRTYELHNAQIIGLINIGTIVISYDEDNVLHVIDIKARKPLHSIKLLNSARITCVSHPATYINKVIIGFDNGDLELWNFMKQRVIYTFKSHVANLGRKQRSAAVFDDTENFSTTLPRITCIEQSPACDVVAVGCSSGDILIMNLKLDKVLFSFVQDHGAVTSLSFRNDHGAEVHPYLASASEDGRILLWNLGRETSASASLSSLNEDDDGQGFSEAHVISSFGKKQKLVRGLESTLDDAHLTKVSSLHFLYGEPILISSSTDNSIKVWIFDASDGSARLLRCREGHNGPSRHLRYLWSSTSSSASGGGDSADARACELLSSGVDNTFRYFNTAIEAQNREMSQKVITKKLGFRRRHERLPAMVGMDCCETRRRDWGDVITIHQNHACAYVWKSKDKTSTEVILRQSHWREGDNSLYHSDRDTHATAVCMSPCGNFAVVGTRGGMAYVYNIQSGNPRGSFPPPAPGSEVSKSKGAATIQKMLEDNELDGDEVRVAKKKKNDSLEPSLIQGHRGEITGLWIDLTSTTLVTCGLDGLIIFWDFSSHREVHRVDTGVPQQRLQGFRDGGFVATAGQDRVVRVWDVSTRKLARRFGGMSREVSDMSFTPDGRRLLISSLDGSLRTWDMPTGRCISWVTFGSPILSIAVSPTGEYLCLSQAERDGLFLYLDRSLFETVHFWKEPTSPTPVVNCEVRIDLTETSYRDASRGDGDDDSDVDDDDKFVIQAGQGQVVDDDEQNGVNSETTEQRGFGTITMSAVPRAYWVTLFHLDEIKERNKAKAPAEAPVQAPFFLPTLLKGGVTPAFPTAQEFAKIVSRDGLAMPGSDKPSEEQKGELKRMIGDADDSTAKKPRKEPTEDERIMSELAGMGTAWGDEDDGNNDDSWGDEEGGDDNDDEGNHDFAIDRKPSSANALDHNDNAASNKSKSRILTASSKILKRKSVAPRCSLLAFLMNEFPSAFDEDGNILSEDMITSDLFSTTDSEVSPVLTFLKSSSPPSIDMEMRLLCRHDDDVEGLTIVKLFLVWLTKQFQIGTDFEILQAYLHRFLAIYSTTLLEKRVFTFQLSLLLKAHDECSARFRNMVQKNLCLLKMFAHLPMM